MVYGDFCYFGIRKMIIHILAKHSENIPPDNIIHVQFGIDGVPLAKSSASSFWPILIKIREYPDVLPVAVYHGKSSSKPPDVHIYLREFVEELKYIMQSGVVVDSTVMHVRVSAFIMDAPAKSYVLDIKVCI